MRSPEVDHFCLLVRSLSADWVARSPSGDPLTGEARRDRLEMWTQAKERIRQVAATAETMDDVPAWLLDLAEQLGVRKPAPRVAGPDPRYPTVVFPPEYWGSDADLENEDWPKRRTWDLPTDKAEFQAFLRMCCNVTRTSVKTEVAEFKRLPIYRWHKNNLPLDDWLRELEDEET